MDLSGAIELIRETNEPLAVALQAIITEQNRIGKSQEKVIEALILHLMAPPGNPSTIDLTFILKTLKDN